MSSAPAGGIALIVVAGIIVIAGIVAALHGVGAAVLRWLRHARPLPIGTHMEFWRRVRHRAGTASRAPGTFVQDPAPEGLHTPTPQTPDPDLPEVPASPITAPQYVHACLQH